MGASPILAPHAPVHAVGNACALDAECLGLPGHRVDPTRLVVDVAGLGYTGVAAERVLGDRHAVAPEMSDLVGLVCLITPGDSRGTIDRFVAKVTALADERRPALSAPSSLRSAAAAVSPGVQAMTPREAFFSPVRAVSPWEAVGEVAAEPVTPYPPGIPVLTPGEVVSAEKIAYLCAALATGMHLRGPADPSLGTIRVVGGDRGGDHDRDGCGARVRAGAPARPR